MPGVTLAKITTKWCCKNFVGNKNRNLSGDSLSTRRGNNMALRHGGVGGGDPDEEANIRSFFRTNGSF